jgi:DNA topoisomerase I
MKLLIVESPNKIKKLKTFLDGSWALGASVGHVCDLPDKEIGIDLEQGSFDQKYRVYSDKIKIVNNLKVLAAKAEAVYLASDPDR